MNLQICPKFLMPVPFRTIFSHILLSNAFDRFTIIMKKYRLHYATTKITSNILSAPSTSQSSFNKDCFVLFVLSSALFVVAGLSEKTNSKLFSEHHPEKGDSQFVASDDDDTAEFATHRRIEAEHLSIKESVHCFSGSKEDGFCVDVHIQLIQS